MPLTPPLRNPGDDQPVMPRPRGPETGVYIARVYHGSETSVEAFVVSLNLKRRHLSENQRAMVAARLANLKHGDNQYTMDAQICASTSQPDAAELLNVSRRSVQHAVAVQRAGTPELIAAVDAGQVSVSAAAGPDAMKNAAMDCTTVLVKGTSGRLKHAAGESRCLACCSATIYGACTD